MITLTDQQREALREAMARAVCRYDGHNPDELWDIGAHAKFEAPEPAWHSYTDDIDPLVDVLWDAALPAIIGAVLERAALWHEEEAKAHEWSAAQECDKGDDDWVRNMACARTHRRSAKAIRALAEEAR